MNPFKEDYLKTLSYKDLKLQLSNLKNQFEKIYEKCKEFNVRLNNMSSDEQNEYYRRKGFPIGLLVDRQGVGINPYSDFLSNIRIKVTNIKNEIKIRKEIRNEIAEKKFNDNIKNYVFYFTIILILYVLFSNYLKKENI